MQLPNINNNNLLPIYLFVSLLMILTGCVHPEKNIDTKPYFPVGKIHQMVIL